MMLHHLNIAVPDKAKMPTGIKGFDKIIDGGLPRNKSTIICGNTGSGKTFMSLEFLVRGGRDFGEPGVMLSFEETKEELLQNFHSLDLDSVVSKKLIHIEYIEIDRNPVNETGVYNLDGLFVRLGNAIDGIGAKRVVLDSLDTIFQGFDTTILRSELTRLFKWLKEKKVTAVITTEIESEIFTPKRIEQYLADCVIVLDNRVHGQIATRRLRVLKMRGSHHENNEYPFTIDRDGVSVQPLVSELISQELSSTRITSGIKDLDQMLDGRGYYQGSSILVSGSAGTGKTSIAVSLINAHCDKKARSLYCAFEESVPQIVRNMGSIGLDIEQYLKSDLLKFYVCRPTLQNLELHLMAIKEIVEAFKPEFIVLDPVTNLMSEGINSDIRHLLSYFVDYLKSKNITTLFTAAITLDSIKSNASDEGLSAIMDTWILVRDIEKNSERNRGIYVLKSRGMNHSSQIREFVITDKGLLLLPTYLGPNGVLMGSAKLEHTMEQDEDLKRNDSKILLQTSRNKRKRKTLEDKIAALKYELETEILVSENAAREYQEQLKRAQDDNTELVKLRNSNSSSAEKIKTRNN